MDDRIFNVRTDLNACDRTRGCTAIRRSVSTEMLTWLEKKKKNPLPHRGIEPASAACRSDAPSTELQPQPYLGVVLHERRVIKYAQTCDSVEPPFADPLRLTGR